MSEGVELGTAPIHRLRVGQGDWPNPIMIPVQGVESLTVEWLRSPWRAFAAGSSPAISR
jgi:hypothetical protein